MEGTILIYGATGYTGKLIAKATVEWVCAHILAGRKIEKVKAVAEPLGLIGRAFDLRAPAILDTALKDVSVVLCVAGLFPRRRGRRRRRVSATGFTISTSPGKLTSLRRWRCAMPRPSGRA